MALTTETVALTSKTLTTTATAATTHPAVAQIIEAEKKLPEPARKLFEISFLGISLWQLVMAFLLILASLILRRVVVAVLQRLAGGKDYEPTRFDRMICKASANPAGMAILMFGILGAVKVFVLPKAVDAFATNLCAAILYVVAAWLLFNLTDAVGAYLSRIAQRTETRLDEQLVPIFRKAVKVFVTIIAALQVIDQLGGDVKGLLAGLTLGGLAFSLAARDSIANVFGSIVILADRPFHIGDWIEGDGIEGTVEEIGFRSTRIRTFAKSLVTVPNSVVANWAVNNWSAMPKRRVKMTVGISYEATPEQMEAVLEGIRDLLRNDPRVDQDFFLVNFTEFGDYALEIFLYYFTVTTDWAQYLKAREEINLAIMRLVSSLGLEIAFPTRTIYMRQDRAPERPPQLREEKQPRPG